jgi:hypothetical protein
MQFGSTENLGLTVTAAGGTLTGWVTGFGGLTPLAAMRTAPDSGVPTVCVVPSTGLTVPAGATLGHAAGRVGRLFWYLLDDMTLAVSGRDFGREGRAAVTAVSPAAGDCMALYGPAAGVRYFVRVGMTRDVQATPGVWAAPPLTLLAGEFVKPLGAFHAYPGDVAKYYGTYDRDPMPCNVAELNTGEFDPAAGRWCVQPEEPSVWDCYGVCCWDVPPPGGWLACWLFVQPGAGATWQETSGYDSVCAQNDPYPRNPSGTATARRVLLRPTDSLRFHVGHACGGSVKLTSAVGTYPPGGPGRNTINYFEGHQLPVLV